MEAPRFKKIYLEISNICNLQCSFCPVVERDKQSLSLSELREYLRQVKNLAERVCFHVMGEPTNHPDFKEAVEIADQEGVKLEITTNGTLLSEKIQEALLSPAIQQINFSLQSFVDNFPKADPNTYFSNILSFVLKAEQMRPELYINFRFWNLESNEQQNPINEFFLKKIEETYHLKVNRNVDPAFNKSKRLRQRIYLHFDSRFEWPQLNRPIHSLRGTCWGARSQLAVHANGDVVPCCLDKEANIKLGSLKTMSLSEILMSQRYVELKKGFETGELKEELCQKCTYRARFSTSTT